MYNILSKVNISDRQTDKKIINIFKNNYQILKASYLIVSTLGLLLCFLTSFDSYARYISLSLLILSAPFLLTELLSKRFFKMPYSILIIAFLITYFITIIFSEKKDLLSTIHVFLWMIVYMILFYTSGVECKTYKDILRVAKTYFFVISLVTFIISLIGVFTYLFQVYFDKSFFFLAGRVRSITIDPIQLSWVSFISMTSSLFLFFFPGSSVRSKCFAVVSIFISFLSVVLTMTRNTEYSLIALVGILSFLLIYIYWNKKIKNVIVISILCSVVIVLFSLSFFPLVKTSMINFSLFSESQYNLSHLKPNQSITETTEKENQVTEVTKPNNDNHEEPKKDPSNNENLKRTDYINGVFKYGLSGRFEIWEMGLKVVSKYPLFGVSSGDMLYQTVKINKNTSLYKNTFPYFNDVVFISQHNGFMQVLVASGFLGLFFTCLFMILLSIKVLKYLYVKIREDDVYIIAVLGSNVAVIFYILSFGQSISYFLVSYFSAYFWICLGLMINLIKKKEREESEEYIFTQIL